MSKGLHVLVIRFSALGDVVLTTSLLAALRDRHPGIHVTYVTKHRFVPLLEGAPGVEPIGLGPTQSPRDIGTRLADRRFDLVLDLHRSWRSLLLRRYVGRSSPWYTMRKPRWTRLRSVWINGGTRVRPVVTGYFDTARALDPGPPRPPELHTPADAEAASLLSGTVRPVGLAPGAAHWNKRWPTRHWVTLAGRLRRMGCTPIAVGRPPEAAFFAPGDVVDATGLTLTGCIDIVRHCRTLVSNDSGLLHVATATATPRVALFGPTTPTQGFAPTDPGVRILDNTLGCRPCSTHGGSDCPAGHHRCLEVLHPDRVAAAVEALAT